MCLSSSCFGGHFTCRVKPRVKLIICLEFSADALLRGAVLFEGTVNGERNFTNEA